MNALLSRKQVEELAAQNPIAALARCREVLNRQTVARDSKREAWHRLAARIEAAMPKTETAIQPAPEPVKSEVVAMPKPKKASAAKPEQTKKGCWQVEGTDGSRIVPYTTKSVKGLFGGKPCTLSDETWRYLSRPFSKGKPMCAGGIDQMERDLADYYRSINHNPHPESVKGCGDHELLAMALDCDVAPRLNGEE
jgi:hypothetical protein